MEIPGNSLDDVLIELYEKLLAKGSRNEGGTRGPSREMLGVTLRINNPMSRLSRSENRGKPFSALGELLWYLSGSESLDFIAPYIPAYRDDAVDGVLPGAYGPRLFAKSGSINQVDNVIRLLTDSPGSRRAVIQLFDASDIEVRKSEIPCTTTIQFHLRENFLHMSVTMRSNDAYLGLPHDVFCFTMFQEMMSRRLRVELGGYIHHAGSMHVYDRNADALGAYIAEGYHRPNAMSRMPDGDPFNVVSCLIWAEQQIRAGNQVSANTIVSEPYWADIIRLIEAFWAPRDGHRLDELKTEFADPIFRIYLEGRRRSLTSGPEMGNPEGGVA